MRWWLFGLGGLLVLIVALLAAIPALVDLNDYKDAIVSEVKKATGRDVAIDGSIALSLLPSPRVTVTRVRLGNLPDAAAPDMVRLDSVDAELALRPLLAGRLQVVSLTLVQPVVTLERLADGRANWEFAGAGDGRGQLPIALDHVAITNGTFIFRSAGAGTTFQADRIDAVASMDSLAGPFAAEGTLASGGIDLGFKARIGDLAKAVIPVGLDVTVGGANVAFSGSLEGLAERPEVSGQLEVKAGAIDEVMAALIPNAAERPNVTGNFAAKGVITASGEAITVTDLEVALGDSRTRGAATIVPGAPLRVDAVLAINLLDLDALLVPNADAATTGSGAMVLPTGLVGSLDASVDAMTLRGGVIQQARIKVDLGDGRLTVERASVLLPGGSDIALSGVVATESGVPSFAGRVEAASDDLRSLLAWLAVDVPDVSEDRLRRLGLGADLVASPDLIALSAMDLRIDQTRLTGSISVVPGPRPRVEATIAADKINLDAYLPAQSDAPGTVPDVDAEVRVTAAQATLQGVTLTGVDAAFGFARTGVRLDRLVVVDVAGAAVSVTGTIDPIGGHVDLSYRIGTSDLGGILTLAGMAQPQRWGELGKTTIQGTVTGGRDTFDLALDASAAAGDLAVAGRVTLAAANPAFDVTIAGTLRDVARVLRVADVLAPESIGALGPVAVQGTCSGTGDKFAFDATLAAIGATARAKGDLAFGADGMRWNAEVAVKHPEAGDLVSHLGGTVPGPLGPLDLAGLVSGDPGGAAVTGLVIGLGANRLAGAASLRLDGPRPLLTADMTADRLNLDPILGDADGSVDEPWSAEPIDLSALRTFDGRMDLRAAAIEARGQGLEDATIALGLADGVLTIDRITGRTFDGIVNLAGHVTAEQPLSIDFALDLTDADAGALGMPELSGLIGLRWKGRGRGNSERELIGGLDGSFDLAIRDGRFRGFDLGAIADRLGSASQPVDAIALIATALEGGETTFASVTGSFLVSQGVARTEDLRAIMTGATASGRGEIDLPAWRLDMAGDAELEADLPAIGFALSGPIDTPTPTWDAAALTAHLLASGAAAFGLLGGESGEEVPALLLDGGTLAPADAPASSETVGETAGEGVALPATAPTEGGVPEPEGEVTPAEAALPEPAEELPLEELIPADVEILPEPDSEAPAAEEPPLEGETESPPLETEPLPEPDVIPQDDAVQSDGEVPPPEEEELPPVDADDPVEEGNSDGLLDGLLDEN
ncbi:MAG: AsmA family protein [Alphaproteobacteria bacterium]|nr:AsmA family protein [Alphaproteobacteria bacterium]